MNNNQTGFQKLGILLLIIVLIIIGGVFYFKKDTAPTVTNNDTTTTDNTDTGSSTPDTTTVLGNAGLPPNFSTYANSEYGFKMGFPSQVKQQSGFSTFYQLGSNWRVNAGAANQGKAVVSFPIYKVDNGGVATGKPYPLYFTSEVRVGVSNNVEQCFAKDSGYTNQKVSDVVINGVTFKKFSFADTSMQKYVQGESYRTIHDNKCFVIEQVKSGSSYKDDTMKPGLSEEVLNGYYTYGETVVKTFQFTK